MIQKIILTPHSFLCLHEALQNVFAENNNAIFILDGYMISIILNPDSTFCLFDSHARNYLGMPDINGKAVLLKFRNIVSLQSYLELLAIALSTTFLKWFL